jgi:hypothetical protein
VAAAVWTSIAVLAGFSFSTLFYLGHRVDQLGSDLRAEIRAEIRDVGTRLDRVDARLDAMNGRIDGLSQRFDTHLERHAQLE